MDLVCLSLVSLFMYVVMLTLWIFDVNQIELNIKMYFLIHEHWVEYIWRIISSYNVSQDVDIMCDQQTKREQKATPKLLLRPHYKYVTHLVQMRPRYQYSLQKHSIIHTLFKMGYGINWTVLACRTLTKQIHCVLFLAFSRQDRLWLRFFT